MLALGFVIMIKAIIFDLDGTLCDTMGDLMTAMNGMLSRLGYPLRTREELLRFINKGSRLFVGQSLPEGTVSDYNDPLVDRALKMYSEEYEKCYNNLTSPYDGMPEALSALKGSYKLGILSNKQDEFVKKIADKIFSGVFDSVNGQRKEYPEKPDPAFVTAIAAELGALPDETVFVGDSDIDMKTAVNAGMFPLGVAWGYRDIEVLMSAGAKVICTSPLDIPDIVKGIKSSRV